MKRIIMISIVLVLCFVLSFALAACGSSGNNENYERGYDTGYRDGYSDRDAEFDSWMEDAYGNTVFEQSDLDRFVKYAYVTGLLQGYLEREANKTMIPLKDAGSDEDLAFAIEDIFGEYYPGDYLYTDRIDEIMMETLVHFFES